MKYEEYKRDCIWGSGKLTRDLINISSKKLDKEGKKAVIKKLGDITACPIPDIVMKKRGFNKAFDYFYSLADNYVKIKNIMKEKNPKLFSEWGKIESRKQKPGKYFERLPKKYRRNKKVLGPGKYHEFLITRLLWMGKNIKPKIEFSGKKLSKIIEQSKSILDLHSNIMTEMIKLRLEQEFKPNEVSDTLIVGVYHEGFTEQNNCFKEIKEQLKNIKNKTKNLEEIRNVINLIEKNIKKGMNKT